MYDRKEMFKAVCSECGDNCEVPFKPTGSKPVLCSSCFGQQGGRSGGRDSRGGGRDFRSGGRDRGDREMHQVICDDCGESCEVPFRPTAGKPIYCNNCFGKHNDRGDRRGGGGRGNDREERRGGRDNDQTSKQLSSISVKLDRLITLLDPTNSTASKKESPKKEKTNVTVPLDLDLGDDKKGKAVKKTPKVKEIPKKTVAKKTTKKVAKKKK